MLRYAPFSAVALLTVACVLLGLVVAPGFLWALPILVPLMCLGIWDVWQTRHTLLRLYPISAHFRWFFEWLRPYMREYLLNSDHQGRPYSHNQRALIYRRAKGTEALQPFGTELDVYSPQHEWINHAIAAKQEARHDYRVTVGEGQCSQPYSASVLNISAMSFGSLSGRALEALNLGAKLGGFYHDTGEGGLSPYHRKQGGDLVWEIGTGYFGCRTSDGAFDPAQFAETAALDQVKMIEVKLSQGAKPGHGGMLPGPKVTPEVAEARGIEPWQDCNSPAAHSVFSTPVELLEWLVELRRLSQGKPVGIKLCIGMPHEIMALAKAMLETRITPDFIVVDGGEGGTGAAPQELTDAVGMPMREGLVMMRNVLVGTNLRDHIKLGVAGKIHSGAGMARAFSLGADWCNAARAFMFSLGCVQSMKCHTGNCPTGVATQVGWRQEGLVVEDKARRVAHFQKQTLKSLREIVVAMGLGSPWDISYRDYWLRTESVKAGPMSELYHFLEPGELLADPDSTQYGRAWMQASAHTFRKVRDTT